MGPLGKPCSAHSGNPEAPAICMLSPVQVGHARLHPHPVPPQGPRTWAE